MIISASRRTDIPAFYMRWMLERLRAGSCRVVNPFRPSQQKEISLAAVDVDAIVFWTRAPGRLAGHVRDIRGLGHRRLFALVTVLDYARDLEPHVPSTDVAIDGTRRLADRLGSDRAVRWRYDPVLFGPRDTPDDHRRRFERIAARLEGSTRRVFVSFVDSYKKTTRRLAALGDGGYPWERIDEDGPVARGLVRDLSAMAQARGMSLTTCAEPLSYASEGAPAGRCIDPEWIEALHPGATIDGRKDRGQRDACGCARAVDVGMPDTCLHGCAYCYAVVSQRTALRRRVAHDPSAPTLVSAPRAPREAPAGPSEALRGGRPAPRRAPGDAPPR